MTRTELLEIIRNGENSGVEFKRDVAQSQAVAKELVAFANFDGGRVLLGVDHDGSVPGLTRRDLEEWVMTTCRDKVRPELIPYFEVVRDVLEPGKDVAVVQVTRGLSVHHVWHNNHRTYYIRVGTESREAAPEELERLFQQRGGFRAELRPVSGSRFEDLDLRRLQDYFGRVRQQETPAGADANGWTTLLLNTEFMVEDRGTAIPTLGGLLLFGRDVDRFVKQAGLTAAAFRGVEKDYAVAALEEIKGPLTPLFGPAGRLEPGIVERAVDFCRQNTPLTGGLADGARRQVSTAYPEAAVREAIVNALVHRDYLLSATDVELSIYDNRLEVISPGRLPNGITPERMRTGVRAARNELLKDVLRDYGYVESMGMGVPRKIVRGMREHNGTEPDLIEDGERFTVRLWR